MRFPDRDNMVSQPLPIVHRSTLKDKDTSPLAVGEHVAVMMDERGEDGAILGAIYSEADTPPDGSDGKWTKAFEDGTVLQYDKAAHKLTVSGPATIEIGGASAKALLTEAFLDAFNSHMHIDPLSGTTGAPVTPVLALGNTTTKVKST